MTDAFSDLAITPIFPTPFVTALIDDAPALNQDLARVILARCDTQPSVAKSNVNGWQSTDDLASWAGEPGRRLIEAVTGLVSRLTFVMRQDRFDSVDFDWRVSAWANVNGPGGANDVHTHAGAYWSACYYVAIEEAEDAAEPHAGDLELIDPRGVLPIMYAPSLRMGIKNCVTAGASEYYRPEPGRVAIFPSWLPHAVKPYAGPGRRISIAMNFAV